jgi:hypothetical protein
MTAKTNFQAAISLVLKERGYTPEEIEYGISFWRKDRGRKDRDFNSTEVFQIAKFTEEYIKLRRDECYIGTELYRGMAYFWSYKYRRWMRGDAHGNGYKGISIRRARKLIHKKFLDENLVLYGETQRHDEIINSVFGMDEYKQECERFS